MGGGGSSANPCERDGGGGSINPNNKPQPPRSAGKYTTKSLGPAYGPPIRNTGCGPCGSRRTCAGSEYTWDGGQSCSDGAALRSHKALCANQYPFADQCPAQGGTPIGTVKQTDWDGHNVKCQYDVVTIPFDQLGGYFDDTTSNRIKADRCAPLTYSQLGASSECRTYYGSNLDSEMLKRIEANAGWANDAVLRTAVNGYVASELISEPPQPSDLSARGKTLIRNFCSAHPDDPKCGCYNAIDKGLSGCQSAPDGTPGCAELKALGVQFDNAPDEFKPIFQNMKNQVNAMCLSENCKTVRGSSGNAAGILLPGTVPGKDCSSNFNVCLSKLTVGQMTGGTIDASCKQTFNMGAGGSGGSPGGEGYTRGGSAGGDGGGPGTPVTKGSDGSELLITNPAVANVLDTNTKQYGAIGGCIFIIICCCIIIIALMSGGDSGGGGANLATLLAFRGSSAGV